MLSNRPSTVTLAAHARRGLCSFRICIYMLRTLIRNTASLTVLTARKSAEPNQKCVKERSSSNQHLFFGRQQSLCMGAGLQIQTALHRKIVGAWLESSFFHHLDSKRQEQTSDYGITSSSIMGISLTTISLLVMQVFRIIDKNIHVYRPGDAIYIYIYIYIYVYIHVYI